MLNMLKAALILFAILGVADFISLKSRARIPMMFIALGGYLVLTWIGMPTDLPMTSNFGMFGVVMVAPLLVHMGTMIPFKELKQQWRAIFIAFFGMAFASALILLVGSLIFNYPAMVSGTGAICGGTVASVITIDALKPLGLGHLAIIPLAIIAIQEPIGQILAINFLRKHAKSLKSSIKEEKIDTTHIENSIPSQNDFTYSRFKPLLPEKYETPNLMLLKVVAIATLGMLLSEITPIHWAIWCVAFGFLAVYLGILRPKMLERSNSMGITMAALLFYVFTQMNEVTPQVFGDQLPVILVIIVLGLVGLIVGSIIAAKIVKWPKNFAIPIALNALYGFPGNYLITSEASRSAADNDSEKSYIMAKILPAMLVGGFTTVTIGSVIVASILIKTL